MSPPQGWYRAGKALYGKEDFEGALKTFMHAQRLQSGDEELASWAEKSKEQLQRQRRCMRFSVDYSRFQDVDLGDDDEALSVNTFLTAVVFLSTNSASFASPSAAIACSCLCSCCCSWFSCWSAAAASNVTASGLLPDYCSWRHWYCCL